MFNLKTHFMSDNSHYKTLAYEDTLEIKPIKLSKKIDCVIAKNHNVVSLRRKMLNWDMINKKETFNISRSELINVERNEYSSQALDTTYVFCNKDKCSNCLVPCKLRLSFLASLSTNYSSTAIINELYSHGHPKSRMSKKYKKKSKYR